MLQHEANDQFLQQQYEDYESRCSYLTNLDIIHNNFQEQFAQLINTYIDSRAGLNRVHGMHANKKFYEDLCLDLDNQFDKALTNYLRE